MSTGVIIGVAWQHSALSLTASEGNRPRRLAADVWSMRRMPQRCHWKPIALVREESCRGGYLNMLSTRSQREWLVAVKDLQVVLILNILKMPSVAEQQLY